VEKERTDPLGYKTNKKQSRETMCMCLKTLVLRKHGFWSSPQMQFSAISDGSSQVAGNATE